MTEQEQIEEMAKVVKNSLSLHIEKTIIYPYIAQDLYACGYRKLPENAVVLTMEEYNDLKLQIQQAHNKGVRVGFDLTKYKENSIEQARKETAKEFAEKLRNKYGKSCSEYYPELIELTSIELDELLKEYEVEE